MSASKRGKAPRQARAKATVSAIVEATGQVFERAGLHKTTTALVAERAGVSVGSLYQYFPDKQALIGAFFESRLAADLELMGRVSARAAGASALALLRILTEETVALYRRDRALYLSVAEMLPLADQMPEVREGLERGVVIATTHLRAHPELHGDRDPELLARLMFHSLRGSLFQIILHMPERLDDPALPDILFGAARGFLGLSPDVE